MAGCAGAGKSTIIQSSYKMDLPLFGEKFHAKFRQTCNSPDYQEYDDFQDAIENQSIFQARHINELLKISYPPHCLLLHIDLKHVAHTLGYRAATKTDQIKIKKSTDIPTSSSKKRLKPRICDLMISSYLRNPFFSRFKKILVNTINIDHSRNALQFQTRRKEMGKKGIKTELFPRQAIEVAKRAHDDIYNSWERNTYLLQPEKIIHTFVNEQGNLLSNNQCICENWTQKIGLN